MKSRLKHMFHLARVELALYYRFPIVEGLAATVFFIILYNTYAIGGQSGSITIGDYDRVSEFMGQITSRTLNSGLIGFYNLLVLFIPFVVSFAIARPYEDGYFRTLLTYPTRRSQVFIMKVVVAIIIPATLVTTALLSSVSFVFQVAPTLNQTAAIIAGIWLFVLVQVSLVTFVATLTERLSITLIANAGYWIAVTALVANPGLHPVLIGLLHPIRAAAGYVGLLPTPFTLTDLVVGGFLNLVLCVFLLAFSLYTFRRAEL